MVNVASYKNVDEPSLLAVPGVRYVPLVGKVTVAMLERNLLRSATAADNNNRAHTRKSEKKSPKNMVAL